MCVGGMGRAVRVIFYLNLRITIQYAWDYHLGITGLVCSCRSSSQVLTVHKEGLHAGEVGKGRGTSGGREMEGIFGEFPMIIN